MDKRQFCEQIAEAIKQLGTEEAAGCMARSLICMAHAAKIDFEFTCDQGVVALERHVVPESDKH